MFSVDRTILLLRTGEKVKLRTFLEVLTSPNVLHTVWQSSHNSWPSLCSTLSLFDTSDLRLTSSDLSLSA